MLKDQYLAGLKRCAKDTQLIIAKNSIVNGKKTGKDLFIAFKYSFVLFLIVYVCLLAIK